MMFNTQKPALSTFSEPLLKGAEVLKTQTFNIIMWLYVRLEQFGNKHVQ